MNKLYELLFSEPEVAKVILKEQIEKYKPVVYSVAKEALEVMKDYAGCQEVFDTMAAVKKNMFDAYVKAGFTEEQAIAFILHDNLQLVKNLKEVSVNQSKKE